MVTGYNKSINRKRRHVTCHSRKRQWNDTRSNVVVVATLSTIRCKPKAVLQLLFVVCPVLQLSTTFIQNYVQIFSSSTDSILRNSIRPPSAILDQDLLGEIMRPPMKVHSWWLSHAKISSWSACQCWSYKRLNFCRPQLVSYSWAWNFSF